MPRPSNDPLESPVEEIVLKPLRNGWVIHVHWRSGEIHRYGFSERLKEAIDYVAAMMTSSSPWHTAQEQNKRYIDDATDEGRPEDEGELRETVRREEGH
jgi:hypothetical protein